MELLVIKPPIPAAPGVVTVTVKVPLALVFLHVLEVAGVPGTAGVGGEKPAGVPAVPAVPSEEVASLFMVTYMSPNVVEPAEAGQPAKPLRHPLVYGTM